MQSFLLAYFKKTEDQMQDDINNLMKKFQKTQNIDCPFVIKLKLMESIRWVLYIEFSIIDGFLKWMFLRREQIMNLIQTQKKIREQLLVSGVHIMHRLTLYIGEYPITGEAEIP